MEIKAAATVFQVERLESALSFYIGVLGFQEDFRFGPYAGIHLGEFCLHLCAHHTWNRPLGGGMVTVFCDEVDGYHAELSARRVEIPLAPADQPYGMRDFVVRDPDGNLITFSCPL